MNVKDDYSKELVGQLVSYSISGHQVAQFSDQLIEKRSAPSQITCDNGTEFTSKAMLIWQKESGVRLGIHAVWQADTERICGESQWSFRLECLNQHWFRTIEEARQIIDDWRHHYNHERPHSTLNYMTPVVFAKREA